MTRTLRRALVWGSVVVVALGTAIAVAATRHEPAPSSTGMAGMEAAPPPPAGAGSTAAYISPARQQLIGVRTGSVERRPASSETRIVGMLAYDETRVTEIHVKYAGWVEHLMVDYVGQSVRRGQPLFYEYSPEVVAAQTDYLVALSAKNTATPAVQEDADALLRAARTRLEQRWDMTPVEIGSVERRGKASRDLVILSPFDGVVVERKTFDGQYVKPDTSTFKVADLSTIWAAGQAFEYEASRLAVGDSIDIEFPYDASREALHAKIDFVHPDLDPVTRRVRFRATLPNPGQRLKPDTYVTIILHGPPSDELVVPRGAIIDTGTRKYALLALTNGYFDPRDVKVGAPVGDFYPVVAGLSAGDRVVTSAQFLVDSETNLMSAMQSMAMTMPGMDKGPSKTKPAAPPPSASSMAPMPGMR